MGCEKGKRGNVTTMRSSMERRRVSNAKVTSLRQRKYQELTTQIEEENLKRAKEILEQRKSERDRLNAYMHSVGDTNAKQPEQFRGIRRPNTEGMFARPPWTASLRSDYENLIKLREKEIAVANSRIKNHNQLPNKSLPSEEKGTNHANGSDESYLSNKVFEFRHDELDPERFDSNHKRNGSAVRSNLNVPGNEPFADIGTDFLMLEPTVFKEQPFNGLRTGARILPPGVPPSYTEPVTPSLRSCLKSNNHNQKPPSLLSEIPRTFPQESSERYASCGIPQSRAVATSKMETALNGPTTLVKAMTYSKFKTMTNHFLEPDMFSWEDHTDINYAEGLKEHPRPPPDNNISISEQLISNPTASNSVSSKETAIAKNMPDNALSDPAILRPIVESKITELLLCSDISTRRKKDAPNASSPSNIAERITAALSTLPPRYTSTTESWQEDRSLDLSIPEECPTSPLTSPPVKQDDKTSESEEEMFITSLDSEAATSRLIAEVIAVQSRLEECKLKPLDFRNHFADPQCPRSRLEQCSKAELTPAEDTSVIRPSPKAPKDDDPELVRRQKKQGTIEVTMRNHEIFIPEDEEDIRASTLEDCTREHKETTENAPSVVGTSAVGDRETEVSTTTYCGTDNFTEMCTFEDMESRKPLQGAAWEILSKNEVEPRRRPVEPITDPVVSSTVAVSPSPCTTVKPPKPVGATLHVNNHLMKSKQQRGFTDQQPCPRHVPLQTYDGLKQSGENAQCHVDNSTNQVDLHGSRAENADLGSDCSLTSTKRTSKYLNNGYRDLSEVPRPKYTKQHCFHSPQGIIQVEHSQSSQSPKRVKQNLPCSQPCGFHDSLGDKENYGMSGSDDQELSILASLERLDWKLAAISARAMNRTSITPSMASQNQTSIQSAPAATGVKAASNGGTPRKFPVHPLRPSSVRTQKPPTRNFRQRRIVGVTNKFRQDIYN